MHSGKNEDKVFSVPEPQTACVIQSEDLFKEKKLVLIRHNQDWYKLMITKQNKLILMK